MSIQFFDLDDNVTLGCTFAVSGTNTNPTTTSLIVRAPSGESTTYTYAGGTITRDSTGVYSKSITASERGIWYWRWVGTGTCQSAAEGTFWVKG